MQDGKALLLWRHRFITDTWGWEIPIGGIEPGEAVVFISDGESAVSAESGDSAFDDPSVSAEALSYVQYIGRRFVAHSMVGLLTSI